MKLLFEILGMTDHCNLKCSYCEWKEQPIRKLSRTEIKKAETHVAQLGRAMRRHFPEIAFVEYSGGEPFLYPEIVDLFLTEFSDRWVRISTNGLLVDDRAVAQLSAQRAYVCLSLDGDDSASNAPRFGGNETLIRKTRERLEAMLEAGIPVMLLCTLHRHNIDGFERFVAGLEEAYGRYRERGLFMLPAHVVSEYDTSSMKPEVAQVERFGRFIRERGRQHALISSIEPHYHRLVEFLQMTTYKTHREMGRSAEVPWAWQTSEGHSSYMRSCFLHDWQVSAHFVGDSIVSTGHFRGYGCGMRGVQDLGTYDVNDEDAFARYARSVHDPAVNRAFLRGGIPGHRCPLIKDCMVDWNAIDMVVSGEISLKSAAKWSVIFRDEEVVRAVEAVRERIEAAKRTSPPHIEGVPLLREETFGSVHEVEALVPLARAPTAVCFSLAAARAPEGAELHGSMNDWRAPLPLMRSDDGLLSTTLPLEDGIYVYKFRLPSGEWLLDPINPRARRSGAVMNSLLIVGGTPEPLMHAPCPPLLFLEDDGRVCVRAWARPDAGPVLLRSLSGSVPFDVLLEPVGRSNDLDLLSGWLPGADPCVEYVFVLADGRTVGPVDGGGARSPDGPPDRRFALPRSSLVRAMPDWWRGGVFVRMPFSACNADTEDPRSSLVARDCSTEAERSGSQPEQSSAQGGRSSGQGQQSSGHREWSSGHREWSSGHRDHSGREFGGMLADLVASGVTGIELREKDCPRTKMPTIVAASRRHGLKTMMRVRLDVGECTGSAASPDASPRDAGSRDPSSRGAASCVSSEVDVESLVARLIDLASSGVNAFFVEEAQRVGLERLRDARSRLRALRQDIVVVGSVPAHVEGHYVPTALDSVSVIEETEALAEEWSEHPADSASRIGALRKAAQRMHGGPAWVHALGLPMRPPEGYQHAPRTLLLFALLSRGVPIGVEVHRDADDAERGDADLPAAGLLGRLARLRGAMPALRHGQEEPIDVGLVAGGLAPDTFAFRRALGSEVIDVIGHRGSSVIRCRIPACASSGAHVLSVVGEARIEGDVLELGPDAGLVLVRHGPSFDVWSREQSVVNNSALATQALEARRAVTPALPTHLRLIVHEMVGAGTREAARTMRPWVIESLSEALRAADAVELVYESDPRGDGSRCGAFDFCPGELSSDAQVARGWVLAALEWAGRERGAPLAVSEVLEPRSRARRPLDSESEASSPRAEPEGRDEGKRCSNERSGRISLGPFGERSDGQPYDGPSDSRFDRCCVLPSEGIEEVSAARAWTHATITPGGRVRSGYDESELGDLLLTSFRDLWNSDAARASRVRARTRLGKSPSPVTLEVVNGDASGNRAW